MNGPRPLLGEERRRLSKKRSTVAVAAHEPRPKSSDASLLSLDASISDHKWTPILRNANQLTRRKPTVIRILPILTPFKREKKTTAVLTSRILILLKETISLKQG